MTATRRALLAAMPITLMLVLGAQLEYQARHTSVTVDELAHLPAGWLHLVRGEFAVYHHNPPLIQELAALPLLFSDVDTTVLDGASNRWQLGLDFMAAVGGDYARHYLNARRMIALLTLATALLLYLAARRTLSPEGALLALALFCFCPTWLGHGALVTTDAGFGAATLAVAVAAGAFFHRPERLRTAMLGLALGFALLTKFTALILPPLLCVAGALLPWLDRREPGATLEWLELSARNRWARVVWVLAVALLVLNAGYGFEGSGSTLRSQPLEHPLLEGVAATPLGALPLPVPVEFVRGFDDQYAESSGHFDVYLRGELSREGWWYYYPLALLLKLPLPFFLLLGGLGFAMATGALRPTPLLLGATGFPLLSLALFAALTNIDIGVRYLLFLLPFLYLAIAHLALLPSPRRAVRALIGLCLLWYVASSTLGAPHYIAYFSDWVGGWNRGHHWLADSNLDWGQDLVRLRDAQERGEIGPVALSHFGLVDPAVYGIRFEPLTASPRAAHVVISINHLLGIHPFQPVPHVAPYRERKPVGRIGASLWVFDAVRAAPRDAGQRRRR